MYKLFSVMLIAVAISTPARADVFGIFSSNRGPEPVVVDGEVHGPAQIGADSSMHGYPFYSGCCDTNSCRNGLWDGYCGSKGCGMNFHRLRHYGHLQGGCGCDAGCGMAYGHSSCGKGGCGCAGTHGFGGKSGWSGHLSYRGFGGKGSCGIGDPCGRKGCGTCAPRHSRLGLFDWLHFGHRGHGCEVCGDIGCSGCGGGKGGFGKGGYVEQGPVLGSEKSYYYGTPSEAHDESMLQPPEVLVEPTSTSDRSAWRRQVPVNPFARPFSY